MARQTPLFPYGHAEALANEIPDSRLLPLDGVGHQMPPAAVWDVVVPAIRRRHVGSPAPGWALVVGCGLGADAEYIARLGFDTVAFDVAETAIRLARERFPESTVDYVVRDLLDPPAEWLRAFDLVAEIIPSKLCRTLHEGRPSSTSAAWSGQAEHSW